MAKIIVICNVVAAPLCSHVCSGCDKCLEYCSEPTKVSSLHNILKLRLVNIIFDAI